VERLFIGERVYVLLSFIAKTILAWIVFVGVFAPFYYLNYLFLNM